MFEEDNGFGFAWYLPKSKSSEDDTPEGNTPEGPVNHWAVWTEVVFFGLLTAAVVVWSIYELNQLLLIGP